MGTALKIIFFFLLTACSGSDLTGKKDQSESGSKEQDGENPEDIDETTEADNPAEIAGAFLSCVSLSTSETYHVAEDSTVFGCDVKNQDGSRVKLKNAASSVNVKLKSGDSLAPVSATPSTEEAPFQIYFSVNKDITDTIDAIVLKTVSETGAPLEFEQSFVLKHINDPDYLAETYLQGILYDTLGEQLNDLDPVVQTLPQIPTDAKHVVFATQKVYPPNVGVKGADDICGAAGKEVDGNRTWIALLSTSKVHARDRLPINGAVYSVMAEKLADTSEEFWSGTLKAKLKYTEKGHDLSKYLIELFKFKMSRTWTGSKPDGTYNADKGTCLDWTVDAFEIGAGIGSAETDLANWFDKEDDVPCNHLGRFYCISK